MIPSAGYTRHTRVPSHRYNFYRLDDPKVIDFCTLTVHHAGQRVCVCVWEREGTGHGKT